MRRRDVNFKQLALRVSDLGLIFHLYQKKLHHEVTLEIFDNDTNEFVPLDLKTEIKYLGILIDSNLTWK